MQDPKHIKIQDFNYDLPDKRIAKFPLPVRDQSKLLLYQHGKVSEDIFTSLPSYINKGELMVFNNTKVIGIFYVNNFKNISVFGFINIRIKKCFILN